MAATSDAGAWAQVALFDQGIDSWRATLACIPYNRTLTTDRES
jgi:hypothetical protein